MANEEPELWQRWLAMSEESLAAAFADETSGRLRSGASRFYYAAYQAVTALLHRAGKQPPGGGGLEIEEGRQAWSHRTTPEMIVSDLNRFIRSRQERESLSSKLRFLYKMRLIADYQAQSRIENQEFSRVGSEARAILKVARRILL